jgi:topoisomerase IA-like protein
MMRSASNFSLALMSVSASLRVTSSGVISQVLNGRFGPYIWNGKKKGKGQKNITIKKVFGDKEPKDLSLEECKKAVAGKLKPKAKPKKKKVIKK